MPNGGYNASDPASLPTPGHSRVDLLQSNETIHDPAPAGNDPASSSRDAAGYYQVPRWIADATWSTVSDVAVYMALVFFTRGDDGACFARVDVIAERAGVGVRTVERSLARLVANGAVTRERRYRRTSVIRTHWSPVRPVRDPAALAEVRDSVAYLAARLDLDPDP